MNAATTSSWRITLPVTAVFAALVFAGLLHHEMWLDETHHWLLGNDSHSLRELLHNARYEGHPPLWNLLLYTLSTFTQHPFAMQVLNGIIATTAVLLFVHRAPLPVMLRVATTFSYFIFYEYGIISRNYALVFLLLVIVALLFPERQKRFFLFCFVLLLLASTHLFATVFSGMLFLLVMIERRQTGIRNGIWGAVVFLLGMIGIILLSIPPRDHFLYSYDELPLLSPARIGKALSMPWKGFFPLVDFRSRYPWNSNLLTALPKFLSIVPALLAWCIPFLMLKKKRSLVLFFGSTIVIVAFCWWSPMVVSARHCGFLFLLLLICRWMENYFPEEPLRHPLLVRAHRLAPIAWTVMLSVQLFASAILYRTDWQRPFSEGKAVADYLRSYNGLIVLSAHYTGPPVSAYLGRPLYYPEYESEGTFCHWNANPFMITADTLLQRSVRVMEQRHCDSLVLVTDRPVAAIDLPREKRKELELRQLTSFTDAMVRAENYYVYRLRKRKFIP